MNIAGGTYGYPKKKPNPSGMISGLWYNSEMENYPGYGEANPPMNNFENWGHFSQVVWPSSHQLGCGLADCGKKWFGLCLYKPAGMLPYFCLDARLMFIQRKLGWRIQSDSRTERQPNRVSQRPDSHVEGLSSSLSFDLCKRFSTTILALCNSQRSLMHTDCIHVAADFVLRLQLQLRCHAFLLPAFFGYIYQIMFSDNILLRINTSW